MNQFLVRPLQNAALVAAMELQISQFRHVCSFLSMEDSSLSSFTFFLLSFAQSSAQILPVFSPEVHSHVLSFFPEPELL